MLRVGICDDEEEFTIQLKEHLLQYAENKNISIKVYTFLNEKELSLTPLEFSILLCLCEHRGKVVSSEELFAAVWGEAYLDSNNTVMTHIARLREKMQEPARKPKYVKTVWGVGYTIE